MGSHLHMSLFSQQESISVYDAFMARLLRMDYP